MEINKVLIATDFSPPAEAALAQGLKIARMCDAEIVLVHVGPMPAQLEFDEAVPPTASTEYQRLLKAQLDVNREKLEAIRERMAGQGPTVSKIYTDGHPDEAICKVAEDCEADVIVVGTHGRTGLRRIALGSVAERVVRNASTNVLVARPDLRPDTVFRRIFVATDFSPIGERAVEAAFTIATEGTDVELFSSWQLPADTMGFHPPVEAAADLLAPIESSMAKATHERLTKLADSHRREGVGIVLSQSEGQPARAILRRLEIGDYGLAVTGSHGRRGLRRWLLGSVSERIVQLAPCSVLVVRGE